MIQYHTSLRSRKIGETLHIAKRYALQYGVTRVTDVTRLDNIGLPVFMSIRPGAQLYSLCVSAGKGLLPEEAEAGAYMEAIEIAMVEPFYKKLPVVKGSVRDVLDGRTREDAILDLCPKMGVEIFLDDEMDCVEAEDLLSGKKYLVPAETVYMPYPKKAKMYFGSSSNGLASGNTVAEASLHGLLEVIERDISSFQFVGMNASVVAPDTFPEAAKEIIERVKNAGHEMVVRYGHNEFEIPYFLVHLIDGQVDDPLYINIGYGCHFDKNIALLRAMTEAAQVRMSYIHGGRDDLTEDYDFFGNWSYKQKIEHFEKLKNAVKNCGPDGAISFEQIKEYGWAADSPEGYMDCFIEFFKKNNWPFLLRVPITSPDEPIQVVKMFVPRMEFFTRRTQRIGKKLRDYANKIQNGSVRRAEP